MRDSTNELLQKHFDLALEAPDGIKKLRELILTLAMQGKLVTQDPDDSPASELLSELRVEGVRITSAGRRKQPRDQIADSNDTQIADPWPLPGSWIWTRFGEITLNRDSERVPVTKDERATASRTYDYYGASGVIDKVDSFLFEKDLLLIGEDGANLINRSTPIAFMARGRYWVNNHAHVIDAAEPELLLFLESYINSIDLKPYVTGTAQPKMNQEKLNSILVPLPPLPEQRRIVAKIDQLMAVCDDLEKKRDALVQKRLAVHNAAIRRLLEAEEASVFSSAWDFLVEHFGEVYSVKENVAELRKAILQLAVMGKLVKQDPNDPPASELLKEIEAEKRRLVKEGKIKAPKPLPPITPEEVPFAVPSGWEWVRWDTVAQKIGDIDHKMPTEVPTGIPFVSPRDFYSGNRIDFEHAKKITNEDFVRLSAKIKAEIGDLIYPRYGTIGENVLVNDGRDFLVSYSCAVIKTLKGLISPNYQFYMSMSALIKAQAKAAENKTTQANVGIQSIKEYLVPIPPLPEQHRIVAKVDLLMALCDTLERQIDASTNQKSNILNAVLAQV